jgi:hypothetical protein
MIRHGALAACVCLLVGACSRPAPEAMNDAKASRADVKTAPVVAAATKAAGCSERIQIALDRPSLIDAGDKPFPAPRLAAFERKAAASFHSAADNACKIAAVRKALAPIHKVIVQSGSGATESTFYRAEDRKPGELVFQWAFNEAGLGVPGQKDIELGLRCWADQKRKECADKGD